MAENNVPDVRLDANPNGTVSFATDVLATIAGLAVTEVEGVAGTGNPGTSLSEIFSRRGGSRGLTRGVKVEVVDHSVAVDVTIVVEYGSPVPDVAHGIQENVKKAIENMSGMSVDRVDVHVQGVSFERENRAMAELEMQHRKMLEKKSEDTPSESADMPTESVSAARTSEEATSPATTADCEDAPQTAPLDEPDEDALEKAESDWDIDLGIDEVDAAIDAETQRDVEAPPETTPESVEVASVPSAPSGEPTEEYTVG